MAALSATRCYRGVQQVLAHLLPATLFGRLAALLFVAVLSSHALAITLLFELRPEPGPGAPGRPPLHVAHPGHPPPPGWSAPPPHPGKPPEPPGRGFPAGLLLDVGVRLAALMAAAWVGARWLSQPLHHLAAAARDLGQDIHRPPLPEVGPLECREASRVFNQMQARICQQLQERDRFVAAVSHDLRTPLTRLRLRAECLGDDAQRRLLSRDIAEMDAMIAATLDHLGGGAQAEPWVLVDVQALIESLADDQQACGHTVTVQGKAVPLRVQASALRRCMDNLVGNAIRYGGSAQIVLHDTVTALTIEVRDHGPGLPDTELERVLAPFYRVETSRNRHTGGVGLGLAIANDIVQRHRGMLELRNAEGGGLLARVELPRSGA
ncbi:MULTISPECIES: ATP-binding protein [Giesbergeria]|uniref:histidine kinase n=1 Tax=Giesbergeria sinuosa TaxID=80883 RepID=A0ABV9QCE9_9BURK